MEFFEALGARVDALWRAHDYNEQHFPESAFQALEELPPSRHTTLLDIVSAATQAHRLPPQTDMAALFGDPPLTVYAGRNFRIEVLFWLRGVPEVHQHSFSGAFHVLEGSSIHTRWRFVPEERVDMRLLLGRVEFTDAELLARGDNRQIVAGPSMYHATYHMDKPSLTVVIRTPNEADKNPQYSLTPPNVAHAPFDRLEVVVRQSQLLNMLAQVRPAEFLEHVRHLLSTKDGYWVYEVLHGLWQAIDDEEARQQVLATSRQRHPRLLKALETSFDRFFREDRIMHTRLEVGDDPELRFFLALLRNVPDGAEIRALIRQRHGDRDVIELIESWVRRMARRGVLNFDLHESWILALRFLLLGRTEEEILTHFLEAEPTLSAPRRSEDVRELCAAVKSSWIFGPLFLDSRVSVSR